MKPTPLFLRIALSLASLVLLSGLLASGSVPTVQASPQPQGITMQGGGGPGFTYQGRLEKSGAPYTGACNFTFSLWDAELNGAQVGSSNAVNAVSVTNGVFTVVLNESSQFGDTAFNGAPRWLQIAVQCTGDGAPTTLGRQRLTGAPYALTRLQADAVYVNTTGPEGITASSSTPALTVTQTGTSHGISASATAYQTAGVYGSGVYAGVWGQSSGGFPGTGVAGLGSNGSLGGYFRSDTGDSLLVDGSTRVNQNLAVLGDVTVSGAVNAPITRYVPVSVGDMVTSQQSFTNDFNPGSYFGVSSSAGGTITFPLPEDYTQGTPLTLDLYMTPNVPTGPCTIAFFVRWRGISAGSTSTTGDSIGAPGVGAPNDNTIVRQTFTLYGFNAPLPEVAMLTIRRDYMSDTCTSTGVVLSALRLSYQATR